MAKRTPIEALRLAVQNQSLTHRQNFVCPCEVCIDAREALGQVEALLAALEWALPLAIDADTGILSDDLYTQWIVKKQQARATLAKFQVQP